MVDEIMAARRKLRPKMWLSILLKFDLIDECPQDRCCSSNGSITTAGMIDSLVFRIRLSNSKLAKGYGHMEQ